LGVRCRQELPGDTVAKVDELTPELEERRAALASKLEDMKAASDDEWEWESFKTDLQEASKDLEQAFGNLQETCSQIS
jgi:malate synthase